MHWSFALLNSESSDRRVDTIRHCVSYLGFAERSYNLYWKRLLARLRVAQVPLNLLKLLKTLASSLPSTNVSQD
jgi:hypothetical protein